MKKRKVEIGLAQLKARLKALRFSALEPAVQNSLRREMFFFNNSRMAAIALVILVLESMNIVNVLCFSASGLTSKNNRQYFTMYLILLISALFCLGIRHILRNKSELLQQCYGGFTLFWVMWHAVLSAMDLQHNPNIVVFVTGILAMSFLVRLKPLQMLAILAGGLLLLLGCAWGNLSNGNVINAVIVTIITMLISCSRYFNTLEELGYRQKMILQENHRRTEKRKLALLSGQQRALLDHSRELLFLWDRELDTLTLAGGNHLGEADRAALIDWLANQKESNEEVMSLQLNGQAVPQEYLIESTPQLDCDDKVIGAAGLITKKA